MRYISPLRYPGGKGRLSPYIARLLDAQVPRPTSYAEPFAGGAGAALRLLVDEEVRSIQINDLSPGIAAFWRCVFDDTERFAHRIERQKVTIGAWHEMTAIYRDPEPQSDFDLGFATFFLNRCNRSGILDARPIGGLDQSGRWKIDARYNHSSLADRVRFLGGYRLRVTVTQLDGREFIRQIDRSGSRTLLYVDPPYLVQGADLYLDALSAQDHAELSEVLWSIGLPWLLTYDVHRDVATSLYGGLRIAEFDIAHTAQVQHVGSEYAVFGPSLRVPDVALVGNTHARWVN